MASTNTTSTSTATDISGYMCQIFSVACPNNVSGAYLTHVDIYFEKVSASYGAELSIVDVTNGLPNPSSVLPGSLSSVAAGSTIGSNNGTQATSFYFPRPVYVEAGQSYAITVRALGNSPDYAIWTADAGKTDVATQVVASPGTQAGAFYYAKNSSTWQQIPGEQMKFNIWRASFNTASPSTVRLKTSNNEIFGVGALFAAGQVDVRAGDEVYAMSKGVVNTSVYAQVASIDYNNSLLYVYNSTGNFADQMGIVVLRTSSEGSTANSGMMMVGVINEIINYPLDAIVPKIGLINSPQSTSSIQYRGTYLTGNTYVKETSNSQWQQLVNDSETEFTDQQRYVLSRSNEVGLLSSNSSVDIQVTMSSSSDYTSPMVDLNSRSITAIQNLINNDTQGEEGPYGTAYSRYISKIVTLAEGQDAEDMQLWIDAYMPPGTYIDVYAKVWNSQDPDPFDDKPWTQMVQKSNIGVYSAANNPQDWVEYQFGIPTTAPIVSGAAWENNGTPIQYTTSLGTFSTYKKFSIKLVLGVTNNAYTYIYPKINDVRVIACAL